MNRILSILAAILIIGQISALATEDNKNSPEKQTTDVTYFVNSRAGNFNELNNLQPPLANKIGGISMIGTSVAYKSEKYITGISLQNGASVIYTELPGSSLETNLNMVTPGLFAQYKIYDATSWNIFSDTSVGFNIVDFSTYSTSLNGATTRKHYTGSGLNAVVGLGLNYNISGWNIGIIGDYNWGSASVQGSGGTNLITADLSGASFRFYIGY